MDKKRILIAIIFALVCIGVGYLLYRVFFAKEKAAPAAIKPGITAPGKLPTAGEGQITPTVGEVTGGLPAAPTVYKPGITPSITSPTFLLKQAVDLPLVGAAKDALGSAKFYNQIDGKFYRLMPDGTIKEMSDQIFYNVQKVTWSSIKNESIIEYPDGANIYYNFDTKKQVTLPKHWSDFSFSSLGDKIAAKSIGLSPENRWLITSDPDGKNISLIEPMGENADKVIVDLSPNQQVAALSLTGEPLGADRQEVLFIGLHKENFKSAIVEGRGLQTKWSPSGGKLLYNVYSERSDYKPELWVVNAEGDNIGAGRALLNLNTWVDKCTFVDDRFAYCGVPETLETGVGFAPILADNTPDKIYKLDLESGIKTELTLPETHTINNMFLGDNGKTLYFTDKNQAGLFSLSLQ